MITLETTILAEGLLFPEGPVALADGTVLVVEIARGTLTRVGTDGSVDVVADVGGGPNGAAVAPDGSIIICNNGTAFDYLDLGGLRIPVQPPTSWTAGSIQRVDLATGAVSELYTECNGRGLRAPNDIVFDAHGGFYFTDHGLRLERASDTTSVFYAQPDGSSIREVIFPLDAPNGVGLSPAGDRIYVAETHTGRVWAWDVTGPGEVASHGGMHAGGTLLYGAAGLVMYDSLAVDSDGNVCVGTLGLGEGGISVIAAGGGLVERYLFDDPLVTNICFGGPDRSTAFMTASGTGQLLSAPWPTPGLELAFNA